MPQVSGTKAERVVGLAASAGGLKALIRVLSNLPGDLPAAVVVVQHLEPTHRSMIAPILNRRTDLRVTEARDGDRLVDGHVFVAPPDRHLLVNVNDLLSLTQSELVHFVRPSADLLFESLAASCKERTIAVVLSGTGIDGSLGITAVKKMGGTVIAQDEASAEFFGMPGAAIETGSVDVVLPLDEVSQEIVRLTTLWATV